jgi:transposase-like protein
METETRKATEPGSDTQAARGGEGATGTRRKLSEDQEREVTRLYAETDTPVSEISKRFGIGESSVYRVAQRHGASLRGRTGAAAGGGARTTTTSGARGGARAAGRAAATPAGRGAGGAGGRRGAGATAGAGRAATPSTNGRRRGAGGARTTQMRATGGRGAGTTGGRGTRGAGGGGRLGRASAAATRSAVGTAGGARRSFRVSFTATRVFTANSMADAIRQAEAAGAIDITGVQRND